MEEIKCFADRGESCCILKHKFCETEKCRFYKTKEQFNKDREKYGSGTEED